MTKTKTVEQAWAEIVDQAQAKALNSCRVIHKMEIGQVVRQGDIYVHCVAEDHARGKHVKSRQLAIGNTQGSRHMAEAPARVFTGVALPPDVESKTFLGPVVYSPSRWKLSHPEHAHCEFPAGTYQITHQMDARTGQRVTD